MHRATVIFCLIYPALPFVWTLVAFQVAGYDATVTAVMRQAAADRPILIALITGLFTSLVWHWWGQGD